LGVVRDQFFRKIVVFVMLFERALRDVLEKYV